MRLYNERHIIRFLALHSCFRANPISLEFFTFTTSRSCQDLIVPLRQVLITCPLSYMLSHTRRHVSWLVLVLKDLGSMLRTAI